MTDDPHALKTRIQHLQRILNSSAEMIMTADRDGRIADFNACAERKLGYRAKEARGKEAAFLFAKADSYKRLMRRFQERKIVRGFRTNFRASSGETIDVELTISRLRAKRGEILGTVCIARDIRRQKDLEREVARKSQFLRDILEHSAAMIATADTQGVLTEFNPEASRVLGYTRDEAIGMPAEKLYLKRKDRAKLIRLVHRHGKVVEYDAKLVTKDHGVIEASITTALLRDDENKILGTVSVSRDVTQERKLERRLERLSQTDALTELFNRRQFYKALKGCLASAGRAHKPVSLALFDVDRFKEYNDRHGHLAGDRVLQGIADVLQKSIRRNIDVPCRFGGDEFIILMPDADAASALILSERVRRRFLQLGFGSCALSMGITQHEKGDTERVLIARADEAMYAAKRAGGNRVEIA